MQNTLSKSWKNACLHIDVDDVEQACFRKLAYVVHISYIIINWGLFFKYLIKSA